MISIIIPAHNEANVISRLLCALLNGARAGELEIIVVCNGCRDQTAQVARQFADVLVIETDVASKSNALNLGDAAASGFPRFFVDADVLLPLDSVRRVAQALEQPGVLVAAPRIEFDLADRPWTVRAFYDVWSRLPYCRHGMVGSGVYAVSAEGRKRFDKFPSLTADDAFVRLHFEPGERRTVESCRFVVKPPASLLGVIKIKTRGHFGNHELRSEMPELFNNEGPSHRRAILHMARLPWMWPKLAVYVGVRLASRLMSYRRYYFGNHRAWERDDTSRLAQPQT
jgi:glycosyltransferase involved in cell wall biosynthesis